MNQHDFTEHFTTELHWLSLDSTQTSLMKNQVEEFLLECIKKKKFDAPREISLTRKLYSAQKSWKIRYLSD